MQNYPTKTIYLLPDHETTVEYKSTTHFKYTITVDKKIRIKVPDRFIGTQHEKDWLDACTALTNKLVKEITELPCTLRTRLFDVNTKSKPKMYLRDARKKVKCQYLPFEDRLEIIKTGES